MKNRYPENFKEDIFVNFCNLSSYMDFHFHSNHYEICCVMKGKLDYVCRSRLHSLSAYDIVFADKSEPHACDCPGESAEFVTINFTDAFLSTIPGGFIIKEMFDKGYLKTPSAHAYKISELITKMVFESDYPTVFSSNLVEGYVRELLPTANMTNEK